MTINDYIRHHANSQPNKAAIISGDSTTSYRQLWQLVEKRATNIETGRLHFIRTSQDAGFIGEYLAAHLAGAAAVPLGADMPEAEFKRLEERLANIVLPHSALTDETIADVLFTTGSTGRQKGVMLSRRAILADADNLITAQGFKPSTVFVICGPLNHIGSLSKIWPVLIEGGTLIILDGMKDMKAFFDALHYPEGNVATFMVPASIRMMLQLGTRQLSQLSANIDFIETGGAAITQTDMEALCKALPGVRLFNTYASTETGIICTYDYNNNPCVSGCCGRPMRNSTVSLSADGKIICGGKTLMSGYIDDDAATARILHDGSVFTNDLGRIDENGMLHIVGRDSDIINIGGYKVSPDEVENAAMSIDGIADCICCRCHSRLFGDTIKLVYVLSEESELSKRDVARGLASKLEPYQIPRVFEQAIEIRHLFNGKVDRKFYNM